VQQVLVYEAVDIDRQYYLAILNDRKHNGPVVIASAEGGMEIEALAQQKPEAIKVYPIAILEGLT